MQLLSVMVPRDVTLDLLYGGLGSTISGHLAKIDASIDLGTPDAVELLNRDAFAAWTALEDAPDVGWGTAGKLLARKRPKLVPVYDRVVKCALGKPPKNHVWTWFQSLFAERDRALPNRLREVRDAAGLDSSIALPRFLDVIVWMRHHNDHRVSGCAGMRLAPAG